MIERFEINGVPVEAEYAQTDVQSIFLPLLREIARKKTEIPGRMLVFLAAPPATGKSTLAAFWAHLAELTSDLPQMQALGMDGFHYHADYISEHTVMRDGQCIPMVCIKGAPESFDVQKLHRTLCAIQQGECVRFPVYDRRKHDVVEEAVEVNAPILLIEGNWLLLDEPIWRELPHDYSIFINAPEKMLRERVLWRRQCTGRTKAEAETLWRECDGPNVQRCLMHHTQADVQLQLHENGLYTRNEG